MFKSMNEKLDRILLTQSCQQQVFVPRSQFQGQQGGYQQSQAPQLQEPDIRSMMQQLLQGQQDASQQMQLEAPPGFVPQQSQAPQVQEPDMRSLLQQLLHGQANEALDLSKKFADINAKIESLDSTLRKVEQQDEPSSTAQSGQLPGKAVQKPKDFGNNIHSNADEEQAAENERAIQEITQHLYGCDVECSAVSENSLAEVEKQDVTRMESSPSEEEDSVEVETTHVPDSIESDLPQRGDTRLGFDEATRASKPVQPARSSHPTKPISPQKPTSKKKETLFVPPPYKPPLPFPGRLKKQLIEKYQELFDKQMSEIELTMPLLDAFMLIPPYQKFLRDAVLQRTKEVQGMVALSHECCAII